MLLVKGGAAHESVWQKWQLRRVECFARHEKQLGRKPDVLRDRRRVWDGTDIPAETTLSRTRIALAEQCSVRAVIPKRVHSLKEAELCQCRGKECI